jgi:hypothetical protein
MAFSSFIANCFKYSWVSKMKPICIPQIFYEDSEFINHYKQNHHLYVLFFIWNLKILKLLAFLSHRDYEQNTYFWKTPVWQMSAQVCGKKYATPLPFIPSPHPFPPPYPPPQRLLPRANDIGPFGSCDLLGQWRGVPGAQHRNPFRSAPLNPSCPVPAKPALPVEKKVSHSRKG